MRREGSKLWLANRSWRIAPAIGKRVAMYTFAKDTAYKAPRLRRTPFAITIMGVNTIGWLASRSLGHGWRGIITSVQSPPSPSVPVRLRQGYGAHPSLKL